MSKEPKPQPNKQIVAYDPKTGTVRPLTRADGKAIDRGGKKK